MSKYDANGVQMCGKPGKYRIYSYIYTPPCKCVVNTAFTMFASHLHPVRTIFAHE